MSEPAAAPADAEGRGPVPSGKVPPAWRRLADPRFLKRQWNTRVVKTRLGLATLEDYVIDRRYGGRCGGTYQGHSDRLGYRGTSSAHYLYLRRIFKHVPIDPDDVLVDVGSGKGRVLNFWLQSRLPNRMTGIEIDPRFAHYASDRLGRFPNVEVVCGDVFEVLPSDGTIYYLFNPFKKDVTAKFKDFLVANHDEGKPLTVVYYMALYASLFEADPEWEVTHVPERTFHPAVIARLRQTRPPDNA